MCDPDTPNLSFPKDFISGGVAVGWPKAKPSANKASPEEVFRDKVGEALEKACRDGGETSPKTQSFLLWAGLDYPLPEGMSSEELTNLLGHAQEHPQECVDCAVPDNAVIGYVRTSNVDSQSYPVHFARDLAQLCTDSGLLLIGLACDLASGALLQKRPALAGAADIVASPGFRGIAVPEVSRLSRCIRCGTKVNFFMEDSQRSLFIPKRYGSSLQEVQKGNIDAYMDLMGSLGDAQQEREQIIKRRDSGLGVWYSKGNEPTQRTTLAHEAKPDPSRGTSHTGKPINVWGIRPDGKQRILDIRDQLNKAPAPETIKKIAKQLDVPKTSLIRDLRDPILKGYPHGVDPSDECPPLRVLSDEEFEDILDLLDKALPKPGVEGTDRALRVDQILNQYGAHAVMLGSKDDLKPICPGRDGDKCGKIMRSLPSGRNEKTGEIIDFFACTDHVREVRLQFPRKDRRQYFHTIEQEWRCYYCGRSGSLDVEIESLGGRRIYRVRRCLDCRTKFHYITENRLQNPYPRPRKSPKDNKEASQTDQDQTRIS